MKRYELSLESDNDSISTGLEFSSKKEALKMASEFRNGLHRVEKGYTVMVYDTFIHEPVRIMPFTQKALKSA